MPIPQDQQDTLNRLQARLRVDLGDTRINGHTVPGLVSLKAYTEGVQRLAQLGIAVPEALRDFVTIVAWPGTFRDSIVSRLHPQGFLLDGEVEEEMWRRWQANDLDTGIRMALSDMVTYGRGYLCAGTNERDETTPLVTVESPFQMIHEWSSRDRRVTAAARFFIDDSTGQRVNHATLYLPDETRWLMMGRNGWEDSRDPDEHDLGVVPVFPMVNQEDTDDPYGRSKLLSIIGLTDAAARALTNAQVATEVAALPQRYAAGVVASDFKDPKTGEALTSWEAYFGSVWGTANKDAKFGQFTASDLQNFKTIVSLYAQLVAGLTGLPMRYLGQSSDNPPSAEGIRADESRIIGTAEDMQLFADGPLEKLMRVTELLVSGVDDARLNELETWWRDAGTPTVAQATDAAVKARGQNLYSRKFALRRMGLSPGEIRQNLEELAAEESDPVLSDAVDALNNARDTAVSANAAAVGS